MHQAQIIIVEPWHNNVKHQLLGWGKCTNLALQQPTPPPIQDQICTNRSLIRKRHLVMHLCWISPCPGCNKTAIHIKGRYSFLITQILHYSDSSPFVNGKFVYDYITFEPRHEKAGFLFMRKQRRRSDVQ